MQLPTAKRSWIVGLTFLMGCQALSNGGDAVVLGTSDSSEESSASSGVANFSGLTADCAGFGIFRSKIEGVLTTTCASCHTAGGQGVRGMLVLASGSESDSVANYQTAMGLLLSDDQDVVNSNPIVAAPLGGGHPIQMTSGGTTHTKFVEWINSEYDTPCPLVSRGASE